MSRLALAILVIASGACGDVVARTEVVLVLDAEPGVRAQTHDVQVVIRGGTGAMAQWQERLDRTFVIGEDAGWPLEVGLVPLGGDASRVYEATATARTGSRGPVARVRAVSGYRVGSTLTLRLVLEDDCRERINECSVTQTCRSGACVGADVEVDTLKPYEGAGADAGGTGGVGGTGGGGRDDAGPDAAATSDSGITDASADSDALDQPGMTCDACDTDGDCSDGLLCIKDVVDDQQVSICLPRCECPRVNGVVMCPDQTCNVFLYENTFAVGTVDRDIRGWIAECTQSRLGTTCDACQANAECGHPLGCVTFHDINLCLPTCECAPGESCPQCFSYEPDGSGTLERIVDGAFDSWVQVCSQ